ncbi:MAG: HEAT repeat domain-containing protein [Desulfobacteraceae bacterium]|nr:HEAT repeat domain-containing protein [Desulfobacteraceae bacterium]MBC2754472.1 HEAT repeat domain-containing protein [Desulfobacteraceae bacterium]
MENGEDIKAAKIVIQMFLKARKNLRMYPANNPVYANTLEDTFDKFKDFFYLTDKLVLTLRLYDIYYGEELIYHNNEQKNDNLAFFFFKDGLRELTFQQKMPFEEMEAFLKVISLDFDNEVLDDDTVTLFWENDFQYIRYVVEDEFLADEDYEEQAVSQVKKEKNDPEKFKAILDDSPPTGDKIEKVDIVTIEDSDLEMLFHELEEDANDKVDKFMDILFEIFYKAKSKEEFSEVADFFKSAIEYSARKGNIDSINKVLARLKKIASNDKVTDIVKENIQKIILFVGSEHIIYLLGEYIDSGEKTDPAPLKDLITYFDKNAIPPFMNLLSTLDTIHARKVVIDVLVLLCPKDFMTITKGLNSPEWYVVRNVIYILREVGDKRAVDYLLKKVNHSDVRVKIEVIRSLGELGDPRALPVLIECLSDDSDIQLKFASIRALGSLASEDARIVLLKNISAKTFHNKKFNEKKEYFHVLSRWKDQEMIDFLIRVLAKKTLFSNSKVHEKRACAAYCLGLIGSRDALPFLYKCQGAGHKVLKEFSDSAIKRIEHESQKRG